MGKTKIKQAVIQETLSTSQTFDDSQLNNTQPIPVIDNIPVPIQIINQQFIPEKLSDEDVVALDKSPVDTPAIEITEEKSVKIVNEYNGEGLAETPPEVKQSFIEGLIKKPDVEKVDTIAIDQDINSSPAPKSATNYARRNVSSLKDKVAEVLARKGLDALNIEDRGVFKCRPDRPIKN